MEYLHTHLKLDRNQMVSGLQLIELYLSQKKIFIHDDRIVGPIDVYNV